MTVPGTLTAVAFALAPPLEFLLRGAFGDAAASALAAGLLAGAALLGAAWSRESREPVSELPVAVWIVVGVVSAIVTGSATESVPVLSRMLLGGAWFLCGRRTTSVKGPAFGLIAGGVIASIFAIWQVSGGLAVADSALATLDRLDPALAERVRARLTEPRGFAFFVYPNALAGFLLIALPFAAAWRATGGGAVAVAGLVVLAAGLIVSGSIGAAGCVVVVAAATSRRRVRARGGLMAAGVAAALLAAILLLRPTTSVPAAAAGRWALWTAAAKPAGIGGAIFGAGPGRFGALMHDRVPSAGWSRYAHDWPVETFAELGFAGLLALGWALRAPLSGARAALAGRDPWLMAVAAAWIAGGLHALLDLDYALPVLQAPWWFLAGRLAAGSAAAASRRASSSRVPGWAVLALSVVAVAGLRGPWAVVVEGVVLGGAVASLWYRRIIAGESLPGSPRADLPWLVLPAVAAGWVLISPSPDRSAVTALELAGCLGLAAVARGLVVRPGDESRLSAAVTVAGCLFAAWAVGEYLTGGIRGRGPFPSPNTLAAWLAFATALTAGSASANARGITAGAILVAGLLATGSTGGLVAGIAAAGLAIGARIGFRKHAWPLLAAGLAMVALILRFDRSPGVLPRLTMWREAAGLLAADPSGAGPGRYGDVVAAVRGPSVTSAGVGRYSLAAEFAHCEPLQFAVEWGLAPLGVLIWGVVALWRTRDPRRRGWWWGLVALGLHGLVDFPFRAAPIAVLAAVAAGVATARRAGAATGRTGSLLAGLVALWLGLVFLRPVVARVAVRADRPDVALAGWPWSADATAMAGRTLGLRAFARPGPGPALARAEDLLRRAVALGGGRWSDRLALGRFLHERGRRTGADADLDEAEGELAAASAAAPWSTECLLARAGLAADRRHWRAADGFLDAALGAEPFCIAVADRRAEFLRRRGRLDEARRVLSSAVVLQAHALQRPGLNDYERWLLTTPSADELRARLIGLGNSR